jgi:hypothetical protein
VVQLVPDELAEDANAPQDFLIGSEISKEPLIIEDEKHESPG